MTQGIIISPANKGVQVVVTDENNVQLLVDSNRGVNLAIVPQPRIEVLVDKGVEGAQGPVGPQGPQGPQGTAATVTAGTTTTGLAGTNAIVTNSGTSSAAVFDFIIPRGDTGLTGATGAGVAVGGTTGQVLVKASNVNYDTTWATITGTLVYQGSWNAATNTPTLTSSVGTNGYYYVVGTSGSTNLNGITDWVVGDWAIFNGTIWQKIDNTDLVSSVNGQTGVVVLTASSVGALAIANNLSDLANAPTARTNLGLGTAATQNSTAFATAAQGATADTALQTVTSVDGSIVVLQTGTNIDLAVSAASPASTLLTQVRNTTGATLTKGTVVYISGATGQISTVSKANASSDATSAQTLGMITANLANNSNGYVTVFGLLQNMDTSAYTDGAQLYLSGTVAGTVTATKPSAPIHIVYVAVVEYAHPTQGKLLVKVQNGYELAEIHDVSIVSPTTGQTLVYNASTDLWENSNAPVISGTTINNTTIGATTPSTGVFTTLTATGQTSLGGVAGSDVFRVLRDNTFAGTTVASFTAPQFSFIPPQSSFGAAVIGLGLNPRINSFGSDGQYFSTNQAAGFAGTLQVKIAHTASAVNYHQLTGSATGSGPIHSVAGSDTNIDNNLSSKGSGVLNLNTGAGTQVRIIDSGGTAVNRIHLQGQGTGFLPVIASRGSDTNLGMSYSTQGTGGHDFYTAGTNFTQQVKIAHTASAVNYVQVTGNVTTSRPVISAQGSDANVGLNLASKGNRSISLLTNSVTAFDVLAPASGVNYLTANGSITGFGPVLSAQGSDTNINAVLQPKGTGALQAQQTDSTATGGNARGANAVDWQTSRDTAAKVASGAQSVVGGGQYNQASGGQSVVVGGSNVVSSGLKSASVGGENNTNAGQLAFLGGGYFQTLSSNGQFGFLGGGYLNTLAGFYNVIGGGFTNSGTSGSAVTTQSATMNATTAVTLSGSNANIKVGQLITGTSITNFPNTYVAAISGTSLTLSQAASGSSTSTLSFFTPHGVVVGGGNNQATGSYSFIGGGGDAGTAGNRNSVVSDWGVVVGGQKNTITATGTHNTISGGYGNLIQSNTYGSFIGGGGTYNGSLNPNTISSSAAVISGGINNSNSSFVGFIGGGFNNTASGSDYATIVNGQGNTANSSYSFISGGYGGTTRGLIGYHVFPASNAPVSTTQGVQQAALLVLGVQTTDATATVLRSNPSAAGTTNQVILPNNSAYYFKVEIIANVTGGGNTSGWELKGVIKRGANAASTTIVGSVTSTLIAQDAGASTWVVSATADTTNGGLKITCTGQASTTIRWVAKASTTEVTF